VKRRKAESYSILSKKKSGFREYTSGPSENSSPPGELFPTERRLLYKRRLEEMAYILFKLNRSDEARWCLAAALDLEKEISSFRPNPFLLQLVIISMYRVMTEKQEKAKAEPSLIIRP